MAWIIANKFIVSPINSELVTNSQENIEQSPFNYRMISLNCPFREGATPQEITRQERPLLTEKVKTRKYGRKSLLATSVKKLIAVSL